MLERAGEWLKRTARPLGRIPVEYRVGAIVAVFLVGGFFAAVVPLLTGRAGAPTAEVNASLPHSVTLGEQATVPVALDNTGDAIISTVCIRVIVEPAQALQLVSATFAGLETETFSGDRVCGGSLTGGQEISVRLLVAGAHTGSAKVSMVANDGTKDIGPQRSGIVAIVAPGS